MVYTVKKRFLRYVKIDTQSDPESDTVPSTAKQLKLSKLLVDELNKMGLEEVELDEHGYVYATIPATVEEEVPILCFCSHVDTSPDASGTGVKPIVHANYQGQDLVLPDDSSVVLSVENQPKLAQYTGHDIVTASGTTLLGADDKAGVAIIMDLAHQLMKNRKIPCGNIRILFTPDEEIGRGVDHVNLEKLGADIGYTLDGGDPGTFEDETFSADAATLTIYGVSAHPGYAKGHMENALKMAGEVLAALPKDRLSPESTADKEGFVHPLGISGTAEKAEITFIIRDFETAQLESHASELNEVAHQVCEAYPGSHYTLEVKEQYRNMKPVVDKHPEIMAFAEEAIRSIGLTPTRGAIRGGTDGSRLSYMGLPCPNLFTGMQAIHSKQEWVSVQDMEKAVAMLLALVQRWTKNEENVS